MKGGIIGLHNKSCTFLPVQISTVTLSALFALARAGPRWRDDDEVLGCFRQTAARGAETVSTAKKQTNSWTEWRDIQKVCSCDTATKKNTTTLLSEFSSSSDWRYEWKQGVHQKNRNKDYIREIKLLFSPHPTNTRPPERRIICVWFSSASYMWDVTLAKRKLCLFPVLPSPAVMVQRRPQQWSRRGMLLHSWSHSSLSLSLYSLCPISLAHCLPPSPATAMAALFCSPSLDSSSYPPYNLSHSPPLPSPGDNATAEQRRPLCLHHSH